MLLLYIGLCLANGVFAFPYIALDPAFQRDFACELEIAVSENKADAEEQSFVYQVARSGGLVRVVFSLQENLRPSAELDLLVDMGLDENIIIYDRAKGEITYIYPGFKAFVIDKQVKGRKDMMDLGFMVQAGEFDYSKKAKKACERNMTCYDITIKAKQGSGGWTGMVQESATPRFPKKGTFRNLRDGSRMRVVFSSVSLAAPKRELFKVPEGFTEYTDTTQLMIAAMESIK